MIKIISTTGSEITFNLSGSRKVVISPTIPVRVSELELRLLKSRIGNSIQKVEDDGSEESQPTEDASKDEAPEPTPEPTPEEAIPEGGSQE